MSSTLLTFDSWAYFTHTNIHKITRRVRENWNAQTAENLLWNRFHKGSGMRLCECWKNYTKTARRCLYYIDFCVSFSVASCVCVYVTVNEWHPSGRIYSMLLFDTVCCFECLSNGRHRRCDRETKEKNEREREQERERRKVVILNIM